MSGTNHNMNHIVKRIETRVLAPPGGFSSISFGNAAPTGDIYVGHDFNPKNKGICFPSESKNGRNKNSGRRRVIEPEDKQQYQDNSRASLQKGNRFQATNEKKNIAVRRSPNRTRRDSLDELIANPCNPTDGNSGIIPGLEGHYSSRNSSANNSRNSTANSRTVSPIDTSFYGRNHNKRQSIREEYEDKLRQQADMRNALISSENDARRNSGSSQGNRNLRQEQPYGRQSASSFYADDQQTGNRRTRFGSGGGKSSLSLSWE